ncbi:hypothetical protein CR513_22890, partial [Mucuna pruriens]
MRACKEKISDQQVVDKILRTLQQPFDHMAVAIQESKNLDTMEIEELQHSLEAYEIRVNKRKVLQEQALQAQTNYKGKGKEKNHTWELVDPSSNKKLIALKWVYKVKVNSRGEVVKNKVKLVTKGFLQKVRIDYEEVYVPVAKIKTIRLVVAIAINVGWSMQQMNVKSAFINGPPEEEVYVDQPLGFIVKGKENKMMNEFEMSGLGLLSYFLGIEFEMTRYGIVHPRSKTVSLVSCKENIEIGVETSRIEKALQGTFSSMEELRFLGLLQRNM